MNRVDIVTYGEDTDEQALYTVSADGTTWKDIQAVDAYAAERRVTSKFLRFFGHRPRDVRARWQGRAVTK